VIAAARDQGLDLLSVYLWLAAASGARRGELCALRWADIDLDGGVVHVTSSYLVRSGYKLCKDTKTHQDRYLAIDPVTVTVLTEHLQEAKSQLAGIGVALHPNANVFSPDVAADTPWNPDWVTHKGRRGRCDCVLAGGTDLRNTAARLGHAGGGATTLRHTRIR
jgi:integrase